MYQVGSACYPLASTANMVVASAHAGSIVVIGGDSYVLSVSGVTDTTATYLYSPALGGAPAVSQTVAMVPPACGLLTAEDASQIAWLITAAWIAAYCIKFLANYFQKEVDGLSNET